MVGYLVAKGASYDISIAAAIGDAEHVRALLGQLPELSNAKDSAGRSALYYAAKRGHIRVVEALLSYGADPNQEETSAPQGAALHAAARGNYLECAKLLLAHGANPDAEVEASGNAVFISISNGHSDMQQLLYAHGGTVTLTGACALGRLDLAGEILALNPSAASGDGDYGPLAQAASCGYTDLVRLLLKYEVNLTNPWYASNYMHYACRFANKEMVKLLLDHGADANHLNWLGISYLHLIAIQGDTELAQLLIDYGAAINAIEDEYCTTPLGWAAKYERAEMVAFLLQQGADKAPAGVPEWATPLAYAKRGGHTAIVEMLL
jgi:ankyrin repeat protein